MKNEPIPANELQGCYPAVITPFNSNGDVDYEKLEMLIDDLCNTNISGILACGTTGQDCTLSHNEQVDLAEHFFNYVDRRKPLMVGAGSNNTSEASELSRNIEERIGPTTLLHATGYKNNPTQKGIYKHFSQVTENLNGSNLILYTVPGRTGSNIETETSIQLAQNPSIIGIKDASGNLEQVESVINRTNPENFRVLSGEDHLVGKIMQRGGYGVISASANVAPEYFSRMCGEALQGNYQDAHEMQEYIMPIVKAVFSKKNPIPLAHMFGTELRLPLCRHEELQDYVDAAVNSYTKEELGIDMAKYK